MTTYNFSNEIDNFLKASGLEMPIVQNNKMLPQHPFRLIINGGTGTGKTTLTLNMLLDKGSYKINYTRLWVFAKMLDEPAYLYLSNELTKKEKQINKILKSRGQKPIKLFSMHDSLDELPDADDIDKTRQNLFIFDDMVKEKDQSGIEKYAMAIRKKNASIIYLTQSYYFVPKFIRDQASHFIMIGSQNAREMRSIAQDQSTDVDANTFIQMAKKAFQKDHGFLYIDKNASLNKSMKYRFNFYKCSKWKN